MSVGSSAAQQATESPRYSEPVKTCKITQIAEPLLTKDKDCLDVILSFCQKVAIDTLNCLIEGKYSRIDPITTSNCCHGMAAKVQKLIAEVLSFDLLEILKSLQSNSTISELLIPEPLITLSQIQVLSLIRSPDPDKGSVTLYNRIKDVEPRLSKKDCRVLSKSFQMKYSNSVVSSYPSVIDEYSPDVLGKKICDIPVSDWRTFVSPEHIRSREGINYAPSLYSTMLVLASVSFSKRKIALIDDISLPGSGGAIKRIVRIFQGDGEGNFKNLMISELHKLGHEKSDPVVVLGGCAVTNEPDAVVKKLDEVASRNLLPNLILSSETHYPMYPGSVLDQNVEGDPIVPSASIQSVLKIHKTLFQGVSKGDHSFWFPRHYFVSSLVELCQVAHGIDLDAIPLTTIPNSLQF